jgi:hypothetical protein
MTCPNSNIIFDNFLYKTNLIDPNLNPEQKALRRKHLYYYTCIPTRLVILLLLFIFKDTIWMPYLVFIASLIATLNILLYRKQDNQWWSNNFSTAMSILLMLASAALILKYNIPKYSIPLIFFISIAGGFIQSLQITFC